MLLGVPHPKADPAHLALRSSELNDRTAGIERRIRVKRNSVASAVGREKPDSEFHGRGLRQAMSRPPTLAFAVAAVVASLVAGATQDRIANGTVIRHVRDLYQEDIPDYELLSFPASSRVASPELVPEATSRRRGSTTSGSSKKKKKGQDNKEEEPPRTPCTCVGGQCMCCTGPVLDLFQQKACLKVVYIPEDFAFDMSMLLNNRVMYKNKVSGKNPPPACISLPRFRSFRVCAKFSNIYFAGRNIHMCLGMEGRWDYYELFSISFECLRLGSEGFAIVSPEAGGGLPIGVNGGLDAVIEAGGDDIEDYDENVVRSTFKRVKQVIRSSNSTLRPPG